MGKREMKIRFDKFIDIYYLPFAKNIKRSWQVDERIIKLHILPTFGDMAIDGITSRKVSLWLADLPSKGLCAVTCNRILAVFRSIFTFACHQGYLAESPCKNIFAFSVSTYRQRPLCMDEAKLLMAELKKYNCASSAILQLLLLTGARKSEIIQARWENIDFKHKILFVPLSKSGKPRYIMLSDEALRIIKNLPRQQFSCWLFPSRNPVKHISDIYLFWNKIRHELGLQDVRIHDLRHSFASLLVNGGHSLFEVQKLLGHSDPRTTMRYAHLDNKVLHEAATFVSQIFSITATNIQETDLKCPLLANLMNSSESMDFLKSLFRQINCACGEAHKERQEK